jgi:predicted nucleic acid-binding protein
VSRDRSRARRERRVFDVVLVDSSIWMDAERGRLKLEDFLSEEDVVATCPIIVHEILRGARNAKNYELARALLMSAVMLDAPTPLQRFEEAAGLYLQCRRAGVSPSTADCLIAASAIAHGIPLLHRDSDFDFIAGATRLMVVTPS